MTQLTDAVEVVVTSDRPLDAALTLSPHQRGPADPTHRRTADGAIWRVSRPASGPATYRITQADRHTVRVQAWGSGAAEFLEGVDALLGTDDDADDFTPEHPKLVEAHRRFPHLRLGRTNRVMEALIPAILEQRVHGKDAFAAWRRLLTIFGERPPGPAPEGMRVPLTADQWRRMPSWEFHLANVDPARAKTIVRCAQVADRLEQASAFTRAAASARLRAVPGVGIWTAAEVSQRAFGDADALSVGDYHLAAVVGWSLLGEPIDDARMVDYLAPLSPHRYRAVRLLQVSGQAVKPKFGPRTAVADHRWH
ncbi:3-methyladenine DNA glycosylase/8-oxoguanine DNA glycosylase [Rhodococcus sp. 27YEA15]|uniref:DNA-3-methyladenine glycosylase family protein n=1 Tax=Rhodococcus sp. 27YEA15 TaxID=3156259 RepID=UPI003C7BF88E